MKYLGALAIAAFGVLGVLLLLRPRDSTRAGDSQSLGDTQKEHPDDTPTVGDWPARPIEGSSSQGERNPVETNVQMHGRVVDVNGKPVAGAQISWHVLPGADSQELGWSLRLHEEGGFLQTESDGNGYFSFANRPENLGKDESILWITHASYEAKTSLMASGQSSWGALREYVLERESDFIVRVLTEDGQDVAGATIEQIGRWPLPDQPVDTWEARAYRVFRRTMTTGNNGSSLVSPTYGEQTLRAKHGDLESAPWHGAGRDTSSTTLVLESVFSASGVVRSDLVPSLPENLQVTALQRRGTGFFSVKQLLVELDGTWGPMSLPRSSEEYMFELSGDGIIPFRKKLDSPAAGAEVWVELDARPGIPLTVIVQDESELPVRANVRGWWAYEDSGAEEFVQTNVKGVASLTGCPPTTVRVQATASGYVPPDTLVVDLSDESPQTITVQLEPAGRIVGQVLHEGEPVSSFMVKNWQNAPLNPISKSVSDSKDGRFEMEAPLGEVLVVAVSDEYPRSEAHAVTVDKETPAHVTIELVDPIKGRGRIVDNANGEPVLEAKVQLHSNYRAHYLESWGPRHSVDAEGKFEIEGFAPGDTRFVIRADGYATWLGQGIGVPGKVLELGVIPLARIQPLTVRLVSDESIDYTSYEVLARGNQWYPIQQFSADGTATYEEAGPGTTFIIVICPDGSARQFETELYAGQDWTFEIPVGSMNTLRARVRAQDGRTPDEHGVSIVLATCHLESGLSVRNVRPLSKGDTAEFTGLPDGEVVIEVQGQAEQRLGMAFASLEGPETEVDVVIGGSGLRLRVIDAERLPLPGTTVRLIPLTTEDPDPLVYVTTDANGEYNFQSLTLGSLLVNVDHPTIGSRTDVRVDLNELEPDEIFEVVLDPTANLRALIVDELEPLAGIQTYFYNRTGAFLVGTFASDESGRVQSGPVEEGDYLAVIRQPGIWNAELPLKASSGGEEAQIQVRRLGNLTVSIETVLGSPAKGVPLELWSEEFGESVASWIQAGRVQRPAQGLVTDSVGRISIEGLPHGTFRYSAKTVESGAVTGTVTVLPKSTAVLPITLR